MAKNINKNSIHALKTSSTGYLSHSNIPNLSIGTDSAFTIQLFIVISESINGTLYQQENGFQIGLKDGIPFFSLQGFASYTADNDWKLKKNHVSYIAVRSDGKTLTMFIGGIPIGTAEVTAVEACDGCFDIGKGFSGGFSLIRVSKSALSNEEILSANSNAPVVDENCVFQTDCQTSQFKDISANALEIWSNGTDTGSGMYTACTKFNGNGACKCMSLNPLEGEQTLLLKLWPNVGLTEQDVFTAADKDGIIYVVRLKQQENKSFNVCITDGTQEVCSTKTLLPTLWQDISVRFASEKVDIFIDGVLDTTADFKLSSARTDIVVGAEHDSQWPLFEYGYSGYIAYVAEFSVALTNDKIEYYVENPPFIYAENLASILLLDWGVVTESVSLAPIYKLGDAEYAMVADSTPIDGEVGYSLDIPDKECELWSELSEEDKWAMKTLANLMADMEAVFMGPGTQDSAMPVYESATELFEMYNKSLLENIKAQSFSIKTGDPEKIISLIKKNSTPITKTMFSPSTVTTSATVFTEGTNSTFMNEYGTAVIVLVETQLVTEMLDTLIDAEDERPRSQGTLQILSVCWNKCGDPTAGGLHYHCGGENLPLSMEDTLGIADNKLMSKCVLVPSSLNNPTLSVQLQYTLGDQPHSGVLQFQANSSKEIIFTDTNFCIEPNKITTVEISYEASGLPTNGIYKKVLNWGICDGGKFIVNMECTVYALANTPKEPWLTKIGEEYSPNVPEYVNTEMLDFFAMTDEVAENVGNPVFFESIVKKLNNSGFVYDSTHGAAHYSDLLNRRFKAKKFSLACTSANRDPVNCVDCAYIVSAACATAGLDLDIAYISGIGGFKCNPVIVIGDNTWKVPFNSGFSYHCINVTDFNISLPMDCKVYDACLKIDFGMSPWDNNPQGKTEHLPVNLQAQETNDFYVNVPKTRIFLEEVYRERLVVSGQGCGFFPYTERVAVLDFVDISKVEKPNLIPMEENPLLARMRERFESLKDESTLSNEQTADNEYSTPWLYVSLADVICNIEDIKVIDKWEYPMYSEEYTISMQEQEYALRHWCVATLSEEKQRLTAELASITNPNIREDNELALGSLCFVIGETSLLFSRNGHVFWIAGEHLEGVAEVARKLDAAVE